jgi:glycosyltransferase involved in cell wall biosynthesis
VIDDGSKDKTPDILNELKQDWNELYNNQSRQGLQIKRVVRSWNAGWDLMRNEKLPMADYRLTATDDTECAPDYAFRKISYLDSKKYCNCFK